MTRSSGSPESASRRAPWSLALVALVMGLAACQTGPEPLPTLAALAATPAPFITASALSPGPTATFVPAHPTATPPGPAPCSTQVVEPRVDVTTVRVRDGETLACLAQRYALSLATLRQVNDLADDPEAALPVGLELLIPPVDGLLYEVSPDDAAQGVDLRAVSRWYGLAGPEEIVTWEGEPAPDPLTAGTRLFLPGARVEVGAFLSSLAFLEPLPSSLPTVDMLWPAANGLDAGTCALLDGESQPGPVTWPVDSLEIPERRGFRPGHTAVDLTAELGTPVRAVKEGSVIWAGFSASGAGNLVILAHGNGWQTLYAHLEAVLVGCGEVVAQGTVIGLSGQSGGASWPHLHFEIRRGRHSYDPLLWLE